MTNWQSGVFRDKCAAQIHSARSQINPREDSDDPMEKFFAQNSTAQLEEFVFNKSKTREEYVSLIAEMVMMLRQHGGKPRVDFEVLEKANPEELASAGVTAEGLNRVRQDAKEQNGENSDGKK